ncbi:MAG: hypothetical protein Q9160_006552 [Pyrenula sp. 1 TL-2023]
MAPIGPPLPQSQTLTSLACRPSPRATGREPKVVSDHAPFHSKDGVEDSHNVRSNPLLTQERVAWLNQYDEGTIRAHSSTKRVNNVVMPTIQTKPSYPLARKPTPGVFPSVPTSSHTTISHTISDGDSSAQACSTSSGSRASFPGFDDDPRLIWFPMPASSYLGRICTLKDKYHHEDSFPSETSSMDDQFQTLAPRLSEGDFAEESRFTRAVGELRAWCRTEDALQSFMSFVDEYYAQQRRRKGIIPRNRPIPPIFEPTKPNQVAFKPLPPTPPSLNTPALLPSAKKSGHPPIVSRGSDTNGRKPSGTGGNLGGIVKSKTMGSLRHLPSMHNFASAWHRDGKHRESMLGATASKTKDGAADLPVPKTPQSFSKTGHKSSRRAMTDEIITKTTGTGNDALTPARRMRLARRHTDLDKEDLQHLRLIAARFPDGNGNNNGNPEG